MVVYDECNRKTFEALDRKDAVTIDTGKASR